MIFLRDIFASRQETLNELYCYTSRGIQRSHWSKVPELYYNHILPQRASPKFPISTELRENCFDQFTKSIFLFNLI